MPDIPITTLVAIFGFLGGSVLGGTARIARFCTFGAIEDARIMGDWRRLRMWALAIAIAILCTHLLSYFELVDLSLSIHLRSELIWASLIAGGLCFGFGMAQVGTCPYGAMVRLGTGDLRSLVTLLIIGTTGYMTMRGLSAGLRMSLDEVHVNLSSAQTQSLPTLLGIESPDMTLAFVFFLFAAILFWCFKNPGFRAKKTYILAGCIMGLTISFGWFVTGDIGQDGFELQAVRSFAFVSAIANGMIYLMTFTGAYVDFSIASAGGVIFGSFIGSVYRKEFKLEAFDDDREMRRHLIGAAMMGFGGITAMGCTIGQGLTGLSTLSVGSLIAALSIGVGAVAGLHYLLEDTVKDTVFAFFGLERE